MLTFEFYFEFASYLFSNFRMQTTVSVEKPAEVINCIRLRSNLERTVRRK